MVDGAVFEIQESIGFLLARAYRQLASLCAEEFAAYGITPAQFVVLMHIEEFQAEVQSSLSRLTGIDRTTIVGVVDRLEQKGLVARTTVLEDRRLRRVALTGQGLKLKNELGVAAERVRGRHSGKVSPQEYAELGRLLKKLSE